MSFILDALKKSERERLGEGGRRPHGIAPRRHKNSRAPRRTLVLAGAIGAAGILVIAGAWWLMTLWVRDDPAAGLEAPAETSDGAMAPAAERESLAIPSKVVRERAPQVSSALTGPAEKVPEPTPLIVPARPEVETAAAPRANTERTFAPVPETSPGVPVSTPEREIAEEAPPSPAGDLPRLGRLPFEVQQAVKPLRLDVHVYDADPARQFVMINGQTLMPGTEVKPGLSLREIVREGAVLNWKGRDFLLRAGD